MARLLRNWGSPTDRESSGYATPAGMIRVVGWLCLVALVAVHYATAVAGGVPWIRAS